MSELGDVDTGRKYKPHGVFHGKQIDGQMNDTILAMMRSNEPFEMAPVTIKQIDGQMSFGDYDDAGVLNQFDNMTGSMNL